VVGRPDLLLVDEPTGNVDQEMGRRILRLLKELNRMGATVLVATHDLSLIETADAPVMTLKGGRIEAAAPILTPRPTLTRAPTATPIPPTPEPAGPEAPLDAAATAPSPASEAG
jgi:cell division transport system ATP-binding protein